MILRAETAKMLSELRSRGLIGSYSEGIRRSVQLLYEKILEQDLRSARLKVLRREVEEK
jgi:Arc/MetJ-type ribon-helix-helix transcriptional regulator